jgi:cytochrome b561
MTVDQGVRPHGRSGWSLGLTSRQVNLALETLVAAAVLTGLASWSLGDRWNGALTFAHGTCGFTIALLVPAKLGGSVRTGFRRGRATRWVSASFGVLVIATLLLGFLHATGIWFGVGQWTALWTHELLGFAVIPFLVWHIVSRPVRPSPRDLQRRAFLRLGAVAAGAAGLHIVQRVTADVVGLAGGDRRSTGSHEVASRDPANLPTVIWLNDRRPLDTDPATWDLRVNGEHIAVQSLRDRSRPVVAVLDCTGGWWSEQSWDAVPLSALMGSASARSVRVESVTGYSRYFPIGDLDALYLAVGYGGEPLRAGHGAPVRLVVPGRRGPEWIKWVTRVDASDQFSWLQPPLPLS